MSTSASQITPFNCFVQSPQEFYNDFLEKIKKAKKRVWLQSMNLDPGEKVDEAVLEMAKKAKQGIDVHITVDWISEQYYQSRFDYLPNPNIKWQLEKRAFRKKRKDLLDILSTAGATITFTNIPNYLLSLTPQIGRNHTKIYLVDDTVWMGGVNFMPSSFKSYDGMIKTKDSRLVSSLATHFHEVNEKRPQTSYAVQLGKACRLLVDNGHRGKSLIYDEAILSTKNAQKEILFISQIVPSGSFLEALTLRAKQGVAVTFVTSSHADEMYSSFFPRLLYKRFLNKIKNLPSFKIYHVDKKVHLKLLVVDNKELFFGSHNLSELGVQFGTEEIMLHSQDKNLIQDFKLFAQKYNLLPTA